MLPRTIILLSVYDGAAFLPQQLDSLGAQTDPDWLLLWRDDCSRDGPETVVQRFADRVGPDRVRRLVEPAGNLGVARSFLALLRAAPAEAEHFAFCDQDDVWLPEKLERAAAAIATVPADRPALYFTRQVLVDRALNPVGVSPDVGRGAGFTNALVQNIVTGCTAVLNREARSLVLAPPRPEGTLHDWWAYLVVSAAGGRLIFDPTPSILYRQHGANAVGSNASTLARAWRALRRGPGPFLQALSDNIAALSALSGLTPEARHTLESLETLRATSGLGRLCTLRRLGLARQGLLEDLLLWLWIAMRPLPPARGGAIGGG
ncbi:MAG: glycosyltransferase family 2 protein [Phenylobacterium sp.]|uniref:glycosyltransferase family 2 protein n=1 Tax=Phenylobacterium sp. TaxID=1871053 RepID=UPI0025DA9FE6|nr:glycosyltransferase family 2 protein [Phenylobacterium sp.]MCA3475164.1 glycosyltransferase family 2 protein [Rhodobacter sp.]MCA3585622.1 glycosyltransferase family 2 protein [Methylocystis sp.]MCA6241433.1 glycosyltransferase family 2 protein [Phenylobacterium sp.]MCA6334723.1 glycosyltransferase family 2 protein [Phenylobacterium sp.]